MVLEELAMDPVAIVLGLIFLAVFTIIPYALIVWGIAKLFQFKKQDWKTAGIIAVIFFVLSTIVTTIFWFITSALGPNLFIALIVSILFMFLGVIIALIITFFLVKKFYEPKILIAIVSATIICILYWVFEFLISMLIMLLGVLAFLLLGSVIAA